MSTQINLTIDQGTDFIKYYTLKHSSNNALVNLYSCSFTASMRKSYQSANSASFTCNTALGNTGNISITMSEVVTSNLTPGRYSYDVKLSNAANSVSKPFYGVVDVFPEITT